MRLDIHITKLEFTMKITSYGVDMETTKYYHDLSKLLINTLDKLLRRNNIDATAIKSYKIHSDLGQDSTSYKMVSAFVEALKFGVTN